MDETYFESSAELFDTDDHLPPLSKDKPLVPVKTYAEADDPTKDVFDRFTNRIGLDKIPNWMGMLGNNKSILNGYRELVSEILTTGNISPLLKEFIIFSISRWNGSRYCSACHAHAALSMNRALTFEMLVDISEGRDHDMLEPKTKAGLEFGIKTGLCPEKVQKEDVDRLKSLGYSEEDILELCAVAGLALLFNSLTVALAPDIDEDYAKTIESPLR